ncbi:MAG: hypothetical protein ACR2IF_12765 [Terriglobales bacterium]
MTHHHCPTCDRPYACARQDACRSPHVYDCLCCYQQRYRHELRNLLESVSARFGDEPTCAGEGDFCFAH